MATFGEVTGIQSSSTTTGQVVHHVVSDEYRGENEVCDSHDH